LTRKLKITLGLSAIASTLILSAGAVSFFLLRPSTEIDQTPKIFDSNYEIKFNTSIYINDRHISIDSGPKMDVPCNGDSKNPTIFGFIKPGGEGQLQFSCATGYLGGISVTYRDGQGDRRHMDFSQTGHEAGDAWDTRAWLTWDTKGSKKKLLVRMVTLTSSEHPNQGTTLSCTMRKLLYLWDVTSQSLIEDNRDVAFEVPIFPGTLVSSSCFDEFGNWKGL
jgi:hypothetical protein